MGKAKKERLTGQGGPGRGQGRKEKYGEPTKVIRVPISLVPAVEQFIADKVEQQKPDRT